MNPDEDGALEWDTDFNYAEVHSKGIKKDKEALADLAQFDKDMAELEGLEDIAKSEVSQMWESIEHWLLGNKPQEWHAYKAPYDTKAVADVVYTVTLKKVCSCTNDDSVTTEFKVFSAKPSSNTVLECSVCFDTLLLDDLTIVNIDVKVAPPCIGCGKALYEAEEGMLRCCDKCDSIWTKMNKLLNPDVVEYQMTHKPPLEGNILRRVEVLNSDDYSAKNVSREIVAEIKNANLITSEVAGTYDHKPVLDIDLSCKLVPSTHAGHYHLYIDKQMSWEKYKDILKALKEAGVIEPGYYNAALARRFTGVRLPWIKKETK